MSLFSFIQSSSQQDMEFAASLLLTIGKVVKARMRGSEENRALRAWRRYWYEMSKREREKERERERERERKREREQSEKSQHIAARSRERETAFIFLALFSTSLAQAFPICSRKIWIVGSPIPLLLFHANSISAFCAWKSRRYTNGRDNSLSLSLSLSLPLAFNHFLCIHVSTFL